MILSLAFRFFFVDRSESMPCRHGYFFFPIITNGRPLVSICGMVFCWLSSHLTHRPFSNRAVNIMVQYINSIYVSCMTCGTYMYHRCTLILSTSKFHYLTEICSVPKEFLYFTSTKNKRLSVQTSSTTRGTCRYLIEMYVSRTCRYLLTNVRTALCTCSRLCMARITALSRQ